MIEDLPDPGPRWFVEGIIPISGKPCHTVSLYFRDPVEAIKSLLRRPSLANCMEFAPRRVWSDETKKKRVYSEISTGNWWWRKQVSRWSLHPWLFDTCLIHSKESLPAGSTVIPVLLGSDKTHLTVFAGDKKAWPLYLSIGNITSKIRNSPSKNAWVIIGYIPIVEFHEHQSAAEARLFHQCIRHILNPLLVAGNNGINMTDSKGDVRFSFPLVAAHIADYPEQILVACAAGYNSPVTTANYYQLGDPKPSPPRTYAWTMHQIACAVQRIDPADIAAYHEVAKGLGVNDVYEPYWKDLPGFQPELVIAPDILHGLIRFWRDHLLRWVIRLVGKDEIDSRLRALQRIPGWRHFKNGIKHLSQWTGREDRELQRVLVAVVANVPKINKEVMRCLRAFHDFLYLAQYRSHSDTTLTYLHDALHAFHSTKRVFIQTKARRGKKGVIPHFCIPKLAAMHSYIRHIPEMGSSPQFSTEIVESLHRPMAKVPYRATNHKEYVAQMCRFMDRMERIQFSQEFVAWANGELRRRNINEEFANHSPGYRKLIMEVYKQDRAVKSTVKQPVVGLSVNKRPWITDKYIPDVLALYQIFDFADALGRYLAANHHHLHPHAPSTSSLLHILIEANYYQVVQSIQNGDILMNVWRQFRLRLATVQDDDELATAHTVQAHPPVKSGNGTYSPSGRCHCVLVHDSDEAQAVGIHSS